MGITRTDGWYVRCDCCNEIGIWIFADIMRLKAIGRVEQCGFKIEKNGDWFCPKCYAILKEEERDGEE